VAVVHGAVDGRSLAFGAAPDLYAMWEVDQLGETVFAGLTLPDGVNVRCTEQQAQDPAFLARVQAEYLARREAEDGC